MTAVTELPDSEGTDMVATVELVKSRSQAVTPCSTFDQ